MNKAIEQYCDAIALGELKVELPKETGWRDLLPNNKTANGPRDIANEVQIRTMSKELVLLCAWNAYHRFHLVLCQALQCGVCHEQA